MWVLYALGSALFAGLTSILAKIGIRRIDSHLATALRTIVVVIFAWLMVFISGSHRTIGDISLYSFTFLVLSGLATGASWICYYRALQLAEVSKVVPIDKSSTVLTMLLAFIFLGEKINLQKVVCMALIAAGTLLMTVQRTTGKESKNRIWILYAVLSALFAALTAILGKVGVSGVSSDLGMAIRTIVVLLMAWIIVFKTKKQNDIKHIDKKSGWFLLLSGLATGASWLCYYRALQQGPASVVVPIDKLSILVTIAFAWFAFKERLSLKSALGLLLITAGTLILLF